MSAALQVFHSAFDTALFNLPPHTQARIEAKIDDMGLQLKALPHRRLKGAFVFVCGLVTIESSTHSMQNETWSTCWLSGTAARSTVIRERPAVC